MLFNVRFYQQETPLENLNYAFDVAEKHLDIPRMLDAEGKLIAKFQLCIIWSPTEVCLNINI